jgi:hypothetical protein
LSCHIDDVAMSRVGRIERAAEQANAHAALIAETGERFAPDVQGRTCPVPMTR